MSLRMADGPVANLPAGLDAYAGYVDNGGDGITWPQVQAIPAKYHLSISIHGVPAMCGDVENGALSNWAGYTVGYCAISNAQANINTHGRPRKLWTAHYTSTPHICSPACGFGFTGYADGTQWTDHGNSFDESLLLDNFFDFLAPPPPPPEESMAVSPVVSFKPNQLDVFQVAGGSLWHKWSTPSGWANERVTPPAGAAVFTGTPAVAVVGGACWVSVEDANAKVYTFMQLPNQGTWNNSVLP